MPMNFQIISIIPVLIFLLLPALASPEITQKLPPLKVMTYNIRACDFGLKNIIATLKQANADIIALQEVDKYVKRTGRVDQPKKISQALGMYYTFRKHFSYQGGEFGLALLSRYRIDQVKRMKVKRSNLILLKARVHAPGQTVGVVVVHFHPTNPFDDKATKESNTSARKREAKKAFDTASRFQSPVLIMGDFNAASGSYAYDLFKEKYQDACESTGNLWRKTWPAKFPVTRIDYIWASKHFKILSCRTINSHASDHRPVVARIQLISTGPSIN
jgi:endonuclease/exonuclease/phosphatase family metal-dependent hydrolase